MFAEVKKDIPYLGKEDWVADSAFMVGALTHFLFLNYLTSFVTIYVAQLLLSSKNFIFIRGSAVVANGCVFFCADLAI